MDANQIAWHNQQIANSQPPYYAGLGSLGRIALDDCKSQDEFSGKAASFIVTRIRDAVEQAKFQGRDLSIWVSRGWLSKTFTIKGDASEVAAVKRWAFKNFSAPSPDAS